MRKLKKIGIYLMVPFLVMIGLVFFKLVLLVCTKSTPTEKLLCSTIFLFVIGLILIEFDDMKKKGDQNGKC